MAQGGGTVVLLNFNRDERQAYRDALVAAGFDVIVCFDPVDALRVGVARRPDVLLTRILQPNCSLDGIDLTRKIKNDSRTAGIYVVITTSLRESGRRREALEAGCDECLFLPSSVDDVVAAARRGASAQPLTHQRSA